MSPTILPCLYRNIKVSQPDLSLRRGMGGLIRSLVRDGEVCGEGLARGDLYMIEYQWDRKIGVSDPCFKGGVWHDVVW
jgi:hypothetical protein